MSELFEVAELVRIAVEDERTGVSLYEALAGAARGQDVSTMFQQLVGQERYHQRRFEAILEQLGGHSPREGYDGEYVAYLRALTDERAFPRPQDALDAARGCKTDLEAVELALLYERQTLELFHELEELVGAAHRSAVEAVVREERAHVVQLAEARRKLRA